MNKYRVSQGGSILGYKQRVFAPGEIVPDDYFKSDVLKQHLKSGYLVHNTRLVLPAGALPPGVSAPVALETELDLTPEGIAKAKGEKPIEIDDEPEPAVAHGIWSLDPDGLRRMHVEELNVMIQERDSGVDPFDTSKEAAAWLSQDFVAPVMEV